MSTWHRVVERLKGSLNKRRGNNGSAPATNLPSDPFPFLSLPAEIRQEIYLLVFGGEGVHLLHEGNRIAHLRCCGSDPHCSAEACCPRIRNARDALFQQSFRSQGSYAGDDYDDQAYNKKNQRSKGKDKSKRTSANRQPNEIESIVKPHVSNTPTSLLFVNKQISTESLTVLYATLTFQVDRLETLVRFTRLISPRALASIRHLRASWIALACLTQAPVPPGHHEYPRYEYYTAQSDDSYRAFWRIVARDMPNLTDLGFVMDYSGQYLSRAVDAQWHGPLREVRGLGEFHLEIWDKMTGMPKAEEEMEELRKYLTSGCCEKGERSKPIAAIEDE